MHAAIRNHPVPRCVAIALLFALALAAEAIAAREFRAADVQPADYPTVESVKYMAKLVGEQSKGALSIRVFAGGELGSEKNNIEQLRAGSLDMMRVNIGTLNSVVPESVVPVLPFLFRSTEHMRKVLDGPIGDEVLVSMESHGLVGLAFYDSGARSIYTSKKPIKALADLKGMKIRVLQSDLFGAMTQALGAIPTPMPFGGVATALKTGLVDAAENNLPSYESSRHFETARYYNLTEHTRAPEVLVFSKKVWDTLSAEDQALLRKTAKQSVPFMRKLWDEREIKSRKLVQAGGAEIVTLTNRQEFIDAMKPVYARFASTPKAADLVKRIQDTK
ncbi:MAG: TRAP transporter substrate-binding protein [Betaproteobacteria bacterium]|nr:TRAP transporter substrate-binding protein [Betaproteobacteria bacterium]